VPGIEGIIRCPRCKKVLNHGLGDRVAAIIDRIGGKWFKRLMKGKCGCEKRQAWLNRVGQWFYSDRKHDPT
jgi:hypothetical protein